MWTVATVDGVDGKLTITLVDFVDGKLTVAAFAGVPGKTVIDELQVAADHREFATPVQPGLVGARNGNSRIRVQFQFLTESIAVKNQHNWTSRSSTEPLPPTTSSSNYPRFRMGSHPVCKTTPLNHIRGRKSAYDKARSNVKLEDLPQDLLCTIVSKLPPKEVSRASVLSSHWRYICDICCFKLCFSRTAGYTRDTFERKQYLQYMQKFIDNVNTVVQKFHGKMVEEFSVKFEFDTVLLDHLNNWVNFAVSSRAKNIAVYLRPINKRRTDVDRYIFPFHLLDSESNMSRLQTIQLSFVSFTPPSEFRGFPSLRNLDLEFVHISIEDLEVVLSNCCNLGWLSLVRSYLNGELKLNHMLPHLRHVRVLYCKVTRIELQVKKLVTFVYGGSIVPIVINQDSKLENAQICFDKTNFRDAACSLLDGIPSVQNLTLQIFDQRQEKESLLNSPGKLSHLRCLQLIMQLTVEDSDKLSRVVSILRAAPLIEKLEINVSVGIWVWALAHSLI
uniref:Uncharacterized protein n=1 Tax=Avena sativa TaxID=4498 RepID=A0ACD5VSJ9_AVESA